MADFLAMLVVVVAIAFTAAMGPTRLFGSKTVARIWMGAFWMYFWIGAGLFASFQLGLHEAFTNGLVLLFGG